MSVHFRSHRGTFAESIKTTIEVNSRGELAGHIGLELGLEIRIDRLSVEYYCMDPRIAGVGTYIVIVEGLGVAGFTDGPL